MIYSIVFLTLLILILLYFRIADHFNIIDKPNNRSSHTIITIRGGGVIFYIAALIYFIWSHFQYPFFFMGLTLMAIVSFLDDILTLSNKLRISVHLLSVMLLFYQLDLFAWPWYFIPCMFFAVIGTINAYNFMDGINGITTAYSFIVLLLLWMANQQNTFIDNQLIGFTAIGNLVFFMFNFRKKAKCFAGDVGSVSMSFIIVFLLLSLILSTGKAIYILFLGVYGVDSMLTIIHRLLKKENIFEAHRSHLYQYLSNEVKVNQLYVSACYALLQLIIGLIVFNVEDYSSTTQLIIALAILFMLILVYIVLKRYIVKKYIFN